MTKTAEPPAARPGLARVSEAAKFLSVSNALIYKMVEEGTMPVKRIGTTVRIPWAWLEKQAALESEQD